MVKLGAHAFVWIGDWDVEAGNQAIAQAGELGFDFLEVPLLRPDEFDAAAHKKALDAAGIYAICSLGLPKAAHMPDNPDGAVEFLISAMDKMVELDSHYLGGCIAYNLGTRTGLPPTDQERQTVIDALKRVAEEAAKRDITLALEACNRYETHMYNSLADTRATIKAVGVDNLKLHADTYHMNIEEEGFYQPIIDNADVLDYVHMSESHRGLVGTGTVIWDQVWRGLAEINFDGHLVLESFSAINPDIAAATALWRPPNQSSAVLAQEGLAFLKAGIQEHLT